MKSTQNGYTAIIFLFSGALIAIVGYAVYVTFFQAHIEEQKALEQKPSIAEVIKSASNKGEEKKNENTVQKDVSIKVDEKGDLNKNEKQNNEKKTEEKTTIPQKSLDELAIAAIVGGSRGDEQKQTISSTLLRDIAVHSYERTGTVDGRNAAQGLSGLARFGKNGENTIFYATFGKLAAPKDGKSYYGWMIQPDATNPRAITTGKVGMVGGVFTDVYMTKKDMTAYTIYALVALKNPTDKPTVADIVMIGEVKNR